MSVRLRVEPRAIATAENFMSVPAVVAPIVSIVLAIIAVVLATILMALAVVLASIGAATRAERKAGEGG